MDNDSNFGCISNNYDRDRANKPRVIAMDLQALARASQTISMACSEFDAWKILTFDSITAKLELLPKDRYPYRNRYRNRNPKP